VLCLGNGSVGLLLWLGRLFRGEVTMHPWLQKALSSNVLIGIVVFAGLLSTGGVIYRDYRQMHDHLLEDVNVSGYPPPGVTQNLIVIFGQTFEDQMIPLDGHVYDHCTFTNVCLTYDGSAYQIQHSTFKEHWKICLKEQPLNNYADLATALHLFRAGVIHTQKSMVKPPSQ